MWVDELCGDEIVKLGGNVLGPVCCPRKRKDCLGAKEWEERGEGEPIEIVDIEEDGQGVVDALEYWWAENTEFQRKTKEQYGRAVEWPGNASALLDEWSGWTRSWCGWCHKVILSRTERGLD